jgi:hypothetical protein
MLVKDKPKEYIDPPRLSKTTKSGICIIGEMPTYRIIGHLLKKHRVGLLAITSLLGWGLVLGVDKVVRALV